MWRVGITCLPRPQSCFAAGKKECLVESETFRRAVRRLLIARVLGCVLPGACTRMAAGQTAASCWVAGFIRARGGADPNKSLSSCLAGDAMCRKRQAAWRLKWRGRRYFRSAWRWPWRLETTSRTGTSGRWASSSSETLASRRSWRAT